jgi:release factor glutamine methyltransferase
VSAGAVSAGAGTAGASAGPIPKRRAAAAPGDVATRALLEELTAVVGGARHEARFIVDEVLPPAPGGARRGMVAPGPAAAARAMAARRAAGEPLQYIFGHWPFRRLDLRVDPRVLIPRPETEQMVEVALGEARRLHAARGGTGLVAVDAGTGSGAIALALATELGTMLLDEVWATDASAGALEVAAANLEACRGTGGTGGTGGMGAMGDVGGTGGGDSLPRVELVEGSWLTPLPGGLRGHVDLVVSNPPYVAADEWARLEPEVRAEPRQALVAGPGVEGTAGLADVETVLEQALRWLARPGVVIVELAPAQAGPALRRARQLGYDSVRVEPDLVGRPRALVGRLRGSK